MSKETEYEHEDDFVVECADYLKRLGVNSDDVAKSFASIVAPEFELHRPPPFRPGSMGLMFPVTRWVVRDEDVKLMDAVWTALGAAAGTHFFQTSITQQAIVGIAAALFKTSRAILKKGVRLDPLKFRILSLLRARSGGATLTELASDLTDSLSRSGDETSFSVADVATEVEWLRKVRLGDGTIVALVAEDGDGRWSACGL